MEWPLVGREAELARALELVESGTGIALLGRAGVGKSRLLHELTVRVQDSGKTIFRAMATESTQSVPFAPFTPLLPTGPTQDRTELFRLALGTLGEMAGNSGVVISIDDAHHLDEGSLALVATTIATETAIVCLTARTGEPMQSDLVDLWTNGVIDRIDINPLDEAQTSELIRATLGEVDAELVSELWKLVEGNPLVLHELVEGAAGESLEKDSDGVWRLRGPLAASPRLADLVRARAEQIPTELRHALILVSVGAPLPLEVLERAVGTDLSRLEDTRLITIERLGDELMVTPAHPLHGEVMKANLGETRRRQAYRELVEAAVDYGSSFDDLQVAVWQREAGSSEEPEVAVRGAVVALSRHDPALAEELVRPILGSSGDAEVILGRALNFQHRFEEAEEILGAVVSDDPAVIGELASARAHNLGFGLGRVSEAVALLEEARDVVEDQVRARLDTERGMIAAIRGDFSDAKAAGRAVVANPSAPPPAKASAYVSLVLSLAMTADCHGFEEIVDDAYAMARIAKADMPLAEDQVGVMEFSALFAAGELDKARKLAERSKARVSGSALESTWLASLAIGNDLMGQLNDGLKASLDARELMKEADPFGLEPQARGLTALERGQLGDPGAIEEVEGIDFSMPDPRLSIWVDRGRVWATVAQGDIEAAAPLATSRGRDAVQRQHYSWGAPLLHDAVRLEYPGGVVDDLQRLKNNRGAHLINAMADHALALADQDGGGLFHVARSFGRMGASLLAAEAAAQATNRLDGERAGWAQCLSMGWEKRCQGPKTPALASRNDLVSQREFQVALDAASGNASAEIADKLYISVRTVDNHLQAVYRKLGVGGREQLAELFSPIL